ncbi:P-loop containing nucleoside triphosphate hydrolase protein [Massarina eburnea CBS 473.64]|uniref:P-loop containing nucleoside triphosphate hydrolase protein n=1 Tax=Massarina eburnea CBS 473.64 TaxID=1395130 RepID=A0A6A6RM44_9PLEO|nr:P-loop containing nucleoside triphosphate hydrolase protein [Massarina eburnea CBS 473.64]
MIRNLAMFSLGDARRSLINTLSKHVGRSRCVSTNRRPFARRNQRVLTVEILSHRYNSTTTGGKAFTPSAEQQAIVELCRTQNVVVSARPGAGKTATAEAIVAANQDRPIAIITYSKRLQLETASRLEAYPRCDIFTFHGLAGKLFSTTVPNDFVLRSLRREKTVPVWSREPYDIIILDEMQDCTDDLFWLTCAFISAVTHAAGGKAPRIVVLGDERQAIYAFRGADSRYLSLSPSAMTTLSPYPWSHLTLSKSFRLSYENSAFVNNVFLGGEQYIVGSHAGPKPLYLFGNVFDPLSMTGHLLPLIHRHGPERTAILAPSVLRNPPLIELTNYLSEQHGILIAKPNSDDMPLNDEVLRGKMCVSTYHQFKGNERDLVIVYDVGAGYFKFLARHLPDDTCPNDTFVALTRARKQLVAVHHHSQGPMPFVNVAQLYETANFVNFSHDEEMSEPEPPGRPPQLGLHLPRMVFASDLPRHAPDDIIDDICIKHLQINQDLPPLPDAQHLNAPDIVLTDPTREHYEAVSDLNGLAVVAAYEHALLGTLTTLGKSKRALLRFPSNVKEQATWFCREACEYEALVSGYKARKVQMKGHSFDWLGQYLDAARNRLGAQFPQMPVLEFEVLLEEKAFPVANPLGGEDQVIRVRGQADIVWHEGASSTSREKSKKKKKNAGVGKIESKDISIWEIKFVSELRPEHAVQACVYAYLWCKEHKQKEPPRLMLFNVRDGERREIVPRDGLASLKSVIEETLVAKYSTKETLTTDEFLKKCAKTKAEVEKSVNSWGRPG